jgi:hypothetical protein
MDFLIGVTQIKKDYVDYTDYFKISLVTSPIQLFLPEARASGYTHSLIHPSLPEAGASGYSHSLVHTLTH